MYQNKANYGIDMNNYISIKTSKLTYDKKIKS